MKWNYSYPPSLHVRTPLEMVIRNEKAETMGTVKGERLVLPKAKSLRHYIKLLLNDLYHLVQYAGENTDTTVQVRTVLFIQEDGSLSHSIAYQLGENDPLLIPIEETLRGDYTFNYKEKSFLVRETGRLGEGESEILLGGKVVAHRTRTEFLNGNVELDIASEFEEDGWLWLMILHSLYDKDYHLYLSFPPVM